MKRAADSAMDGFTTEPCKTISDWATWIAVALDGSISSTNPKVFRNELRNAFIRHSTIHNPGRCIVFVFGSVARLENANDLDILIVDSNEDCPHHSYYRYIANSVRVDLNVVSTAWLKTAWQDAEHGYWLTESIPLLTTDEALVETWRNHVNLYWSAGGRKRRAKFYEDIIFSLQTASTTATTNKQLLSARLFTHEASRLLVCALLDMFGEKVFSHRSLPTEFHKILTRISIASNLLSNLFDALLLKEHNDSTQYVKLRSLLSQIYRSNEFSKITSYSIAAPLKERIDALISASTLHVGGMLESYLISQNASEWLPAPTQLGISNDDIRLLFQRAEVRPAFRRKKLETTIQIPTSGSIEGIRWAKSTNGRLKLIVNTGGCKTPSCHFCSLPTYGRAFPKANISKAIDIALKADRPSELALYNDGNFFNEKEISSTELEQLCDVIRRHRISKLTVESIPRFISREKISRLINQTLVDDLTVAMGMQSIGNSFSIPYLGRPDVDSLFDYAVDEIHFAGAHVRLYLLWGFGDADIGLWEDRLTASLNWAYLRNIRQVSICEYRSPSSINTFQHSHEIRARLQEIVCRVSSNEVTRIELVGEGLSSCASTRSTLDEQ